MKCESFANVVSILYFYSFKVPSDNLYLKEKLVYSLLQYATQMSPFVTMTPWSGLSA